MSSRIPLSPRESPPALTYTLKITWACVLYSRSLKGNGLRVWDCVLSSGSPAGHSTLARREDTWLGRAHAGILPIRVSHATICAPADSCKPTALLEVGRRRSGDHPEAKPA